MPRASPRTANLNVELTNRTTNTPAFARTALRRGLAVAFGGGGNPALRTRKCEPPYNFTVLVLFDGGCPMCRKTVRRLHRFDWLHRLTFADATDAARRERLAPGLTEAEIMREMYVVEPGGRYGGFEGVLRIARVVPLLWPFFVVASLPGIRRIGHAIYRQIAANRTRQGKCTDEFCVP